MVCASIPKPYSCLGPFGFRMDVRVLCHEEAWGLRDFMASQDGSRLSAFGLRGFRARLGLGAKGLVGFSGLVSSLRLRGLV